MTMSFLDEAAEGEWVLRIERAREPEGKRHGNEKAQLRADFTSRGLISSSAFFSALRDEDLNHLRQLIRIAREELFTVVEARNIRLSNDDVKAIMAHLQESVRERGEQIQQEQRHLARERGLPSLADKQLQMMIDQAIHKEVAVEVSIRALEVRRKQEADGETTATGLPPTRSSRLAVTTGEAPSDITRLRRIKISVAELLDAARTIPTREVHRCSDLDGNWVSSSTYMDWARCGLAAEDDCGLSNCVAYAKRAVCRRIDALLLANHLHPFSSRKYPDRMKALTDIGIDIPGIVHELVISPRNVMEHAYERPNAAAATHALELADLLLRATQEEDDRKAVVALNWCILGGMSISDGKMDCWFHKYTEDSMLFVDPFEEPKSAKIVDGGNLEVRFARLDSFEAADAVELAKILRKNCSAGSSTDTSYPAAYYHTMKQQGGV